ncbi:MAG: RNA polymerase sigma factor [Gemmatales bacterium]
MSGILNYLRSFRELTQASESDGVLLQRFRLQRDEQAFATLVQRHGPLVLGIARRALGSVDAADDVFQATFLVLARRGKKLESWPNVAGWLFQVARRTALQARAKSARRSRHEQQAAAMNTALSSTSPDERACQSDLAELLDAELTRLPAKYRAPLVLCQLQRHTREEAAQQLGWPLGSVSGRLAQGKKLLQERLIRRGLTPSIVAGAFTVPHLEAQVPSLLIQATTLLATNILHQTSTVSTSAAVSLAEGVMTSMFMNKLKYVAMALFVITLGLGTGAWAWSGKVKPAAEQVQTPKQDLKTSSLLEQIQGAWGIETAIEGVDFQQGPLHTRVSHNYKFWTFRGREFMPGSDAYLKWKPGTPGDSFQLDESTVPAQWSNFQWHGVIKMEEGKIHLNMALKSRRDRPKNFEPEVDTVLLVLHRLSDYDRLEGVWRKEDRNPVTNELTEINEIVFRNNFYVRRKYVPGGMMGADSVVFTHQESSPSKFELHESFNPKGIDLDISDEQAVRTRHRLIFQDKSKLNNYVFIERSLGIYQLTEKEFKYVITGQVPFEIQDNRLIPNPKSPEAVRGTSFDKTDKPVQIYRRFEKSLKDEMSANGRMAYPPQQAKEPPVLAQTPPSPVLQSLHQQRLKLAQERLDYWTKADDRKNELWKQGRSGPIPPTTSSQISEFSKQLLDAKLALAQDQPSRVLAMEEHLKLLKRIEKDAEQRFNQNEQQPRQGATGLGDTLKDQAQVAQLRRIEFEIRLEEMKAKR